MSLRKILSAVLMLPVLVSAEASAERPILKLLSRAKTPSVAEANQEELAIKAYETARIYIPITFLHEKETRYSLLDVNPRGELEINYKMDFFKLTKPLGHYTSNVIIDSNCDGIADFAGTREAYMPLPKRLIPIAKETSKMITGKKDIAETVEDWGESLIQRQKTADKRFNLTDGFRYNLKPVSQLSRIQQVHIQREYETLLKEANTTADNYEKDKLR